MHAEKKELISLRNCTAELHFYFSHKSNHRFHRRDVPVGAPLDLSTPTGMSCIGTYGENCKSDNVSKYRVLLVAFLLLWHEN